MSDNTTNKPDEGKAPVQDSLSLNSGIGGRAFGGRQINPAQVVHTVGNSDGQLPDTFEGEYSDAVISRFIKANSTPFVSVSGAGEQAPETEVNVDKFTDRFTVKPAEKKTEAASAKKGVSYSETHSLSPEKGRMIAGNETEAAPPAQEQSEAFSEDTSAVAAKPSDSAHGVKTKKMSFEESGTPEIGNYFDNAPTKPVQDPKGDLLREIARSADEDVRRNPDQLMMDGFDTVGNEDNGEKEKELMELQEELKKTRQKRISAFKFWSKKASDGEDDSADEKFESDQDEKELPDFIIRIQEKFAHLNTDFTPVAVDEYTDFNSRKEVFSGLIEARKKTLLRLMAVAVLGIVLLITDLAIGASAKASPNGFFTALGGNVSVYAAINLFAVLIFGVLTAGDLKSGMFSLIKMHPKADTSLLFITVTVLLQNIFTFFTQLKPENSFRLFTPAAILLCIPYLLAKVFYYDSARHCFKAAAIKGDKSYLRRVSDRELVSDLLRDREDKEQNIVYSGKIRFVERFVARSAQSAFAGMPSSRSVLITGAISFVLGVAAAVIQKDIMYGLTAAAFCLSVSFPVSCLTATGFEIAGVNRKLSVKSSFILSHEDARDFSAIDNLVVKDSDIFTAEITNCITAKGVSDKQAKFCAAVLTAKFGGALNAALAPSVANLENKFPTAENAVYEEKLGLSAWVSNCKVLLGTHTFLVNHNVQMPEEQSVASVLADDEKPVYLALEGRFAAVFAVKYSCKSSTAESLCRLTKNGSSILLSTFDANLSGEYAEKLLSLPQCSVRTVCPSLSERLNASMQGVKDSEEAGIVFTDSFESLASCASCAIELDRNKKITKLVCETGAYVGLVLGGIFSLTGAFSGASPVLAVFLQLLWLALCFGITYAFSSAKISPKLPSVKLPSLARKAAPVEEASEEADSNTEAESEKEAQPAYEAPLSEEDEPQAEEVPVEEDSAEENLLPEKQDEPGVVTQATFDALDAFAEAEPRETAKKASYESPEDSFEDDDEDEDGAVNISDSLSAVREKARGIIGGFTSRLSARSQEDSPMQESATAQRTRHSKEASRGFGGKRFQGSKADSPAPPVHQSEEDRLKELFTPPEMPEAPSYDLSPKKEPEENPLEAKFVPPAVSEPSYYSDEMFSRFEDDKIFSPLREGDSHFDIN